jgi:MFS family permease
MFGTSLGFLSGGLISDWFGIQMPFIVALALFCLSTLYSFLSLPTIPRDTELEKKTSKSLSAFFDPLKMFIPRKWVLRNGTIRREYGVLLLGLGAYLAVFATGYIPTLLQMYSTDVFGFGTSENSELISLNFVIRAIFLTFAFPAIISSGRKWLDKRDAKNKSNQSITNEVDADKDPEDEIPIDPDQLAPSALPAGQANANEPEEPLRRIITSASMKDEEQESFAFDLQYTRYSLILDGILTFFATFTTKGWQMYVVAFVLPLAAGTGSAAKGVMLQMCPPEQKTDALSAISLLEMMARLSTTSLFGLIFSAFAEVGKPHLVFAANAATAVVGFVVLMFARFPPEGARRFTKSDDQAGNEED